MRPPDELANRAEAVARVRGTSVNSLIVQSLAEKIQRARADLADSALHAPQASIAGRDFYVELVDEG